MARVEINIPDWLDRIIAWPVMVYRRRKYGYAYRRIYLGEGEWTKVDQEDYRRLGKYRWNVIGTGKNLYAVRHVKVGPRRTKMVRLHREIMNAPKGKLVDHRFGDSLDNCRENLRFATHSQNQCNKRKTGSKTSSKYRGVYFDKRRKCWQAYIKYKGKQWYLGCFRDEVEAGRAYDAAARRYHGEFARLNFPEEYQRVKIETLRDGILGRDSGLAVTTTAVALNGCGCDARICRKACCAGCVKRQSSLQTQA